MPAGEPTPDVDTLPLLPFAQLGLRLLGVMLVVDGVGAMVGGVIYGLLLARAYSDVGYAVLIDPHSAGWAAGGVPYLIAGLYLIVGGDWVLRNVFASSGQQNSAQREDTDDLVASDTD